jgi:predicted Zn-dependent protease
MMRKIGKFLASMAAAVLLAGEVHAGSFREESPRRERQPARDDALLARVRSIMLPLLRETRKRIQPDEIHLSIVDDDAINAASAGGGRYFVTTGLLKSAGDDHLRGVLAHEIAHEDLGHPVKAQLIGAGMSVGVALLERIFPGSSSFTPIAGTLISNNYTRPLELEADRHAVTLLERAGYSKHTLIDTLRWLMRRAGNSGGGLSSHPAISERIQALQSLR